MEKTHSTLKPKADNQMPESQRYTTSFKKEEVKIAKLISDLPSALARL